MKSLLTRLPRVRSRTLRLLIPACGVLGLILRQLITITGMDEKGLMIPNTPAWIALWILTAATALILVVGVLPLRGSDSYAAAFPRSLPGAAGCILGAVSAAMGAVSHFRTITTPLSGLWGILSALGTAAFVLLALLRLLGKKPPFLLHCAVCVWFMVQMLTLYQEWSFDPQLQDYCFQLFGAIALAMTAYEHVRFDRDKGSHRKLWAWSLTAVYLCCLSATDHQFFITGCLWALTNLSSLRRPRQPRTTETDPPVSIE